MLPPVKLRTFLGLSSFISSLVSGTESYYVPLGSLGLDLQTKLEIYLPSVPHTPVLRLKVCTTMLGSQLFLTPDLQ